jgi:hypothetical protein
MTYFRDLATETQIVCGAQIRAIGWLSNRHPFPTGDSPEDFVNLLRMICARWSDCINALGWPAAGGSHSCELCGTFCASGNVAVPTNRVLFVAPEMILHYIEQHSYRPPKEFVDAVLSCPVPGSPEYVRAVKPYLSLEFG